MYMEQVKNSQDVPETENRRIYCPIYQDGGPRYGASMVAQMLKNLSAMQETRVQPLGHEDTLEKGMTTHSSILAWRNPRTEENSFMQSVGSKELDNWATSTHKKNEKPRLKLGENIVTFVKI